MWKSFVYCFAFLLAVILSISVLPGRSAIAETPVNLYNAATCTVGWVDATGSSPDGSFRTTDYIAVQPGDVVTFAAAVATQGWHIVTFSAQKQGIAAKTLANGLTTADTISDDLRVLAYTVEDDVAYIRWVTDARLTTPYWLTVNQPFTAAQYRDWAGMPQPEDPDPEDPVDETNPLYGKTALFVGDSICYGSWDNEPRQAYAGRIAAKYGMTVENPAQGGESFSTVRPSRIVNQLHQNRTGVYDYVIIEGGVNDAWGSVATDPPTPAPVGRMSAGFDPADFDVNTFAGGLEEAFYYARTYFPDARVGYITSFYAPLAVGVGRCSDMSEYFDQALRICEKWGIPVLDLYNDPYVSNRLLKTNTYTYLRDSLHPNAAGYDQLAPYIGKWMETLEPNEVYEASPWYNKKALFVGDSISYGHHDTPAGYGWPGRLQDLLHIQSDNQSTSGWSISTIRGAQIVSQIRENQGNAYDYVIIQGGVNDAWDDAPVGTISDGYKPRNNNTFAGALEYTFYMARKCYPAAKMGYILTFSMPLLEKDMTPYREVALQICRKWQVSCLDMIGDNVSETLLDHTSAVYMADGGHPNRAGYDKLAPYIANWFTAIPYTDTEILSHPGVYQEILQVENAIDHIGLVTVENAQQKADVISAARQALTALTEKHGAGVLPMVKNVAALQAAEAAYEEALAPAVRYGDVNGDEKVDAADALAVLKAAVGKSTLTDAQRNLADVNNDKKIDAGDALLILKKAVNKIDRFPCEETKA